MITVCVWGGDITGHSSMEIDRRSSSSMTLIEAVSRALSHQVKTVAGGYASLRGDEYRYISWHPAELGVLQKIGFPTERKLIKCYDDDKEEMGKKIKVKEAQFKRKLLKLNEEVMIELWDDLASDHDERYNFFSQNCSTIVYEILLAGWIGTLNNHYKTNYEELKKSAIEELKKLEEDLQYCFYIQYLQKNGFKPPRVWLKSLEEAISTAAWFFPWTRTGRVAWKVTKRLFGSTVGGGLFLDAFVKDPTDVVQLVLTLEYIEKKGNG